MLSNYITINHWLSKGCHLFGIRGIYTSALILELYEPGFGVKKFGGSDNFQSLLGCFWNNLQIHIKGETTAPLEKIGKRKEDFL
jgi:hypothetical protein